MPGGDGLNKYSDSGPATPEDCSPLSVGVQKSMKISVSFLVRFLAPFGRLLGCSWDPEDALGSLLGRFWVVLGGRPKAIFIDFLFVFLLFQRKRRF